MILLCIAAGAYQVVAILAALSHLTRRERFRPEMPAVSILKPVYGRDDTFYRAIRSHAALQAPKYEILFGVHSLSDPAVQDIRRLQQEFPTADVRLIECATVSPNGKVGTLIDLAREGSARTC